MKKKINCPTCGGFGFVTKFSDYSVWSERCEQCNGTGEIEAPFTIGDRIRSMSDEDIAVWLHAHVTDTVSLMRPPQTLRKWCMEGGKLIQTGQIH